LKRETASLLEIRKPGDGSVLVTVFGDALSVLVIGTRDGLSVAEQGKGCKGWALLEAKGDHLLALLIRKGDALRSPNIGKSDGRSVLLMLGKHYDSSALFILGSGTTSRCCSFSGSAGRKCRSFTRSCWRSGRAGAPRRA
jgi:hypothetical protein